MKIDNKDLPAFILLAVAIRTRKIYYINIAFILQQNKNFYIHLSSIHHPKTHQTNWKGLFIGQKSGYCLNVNVSVIFIWLL